MDVESQQTHCSQCGQAYLRCKKCNERIVFVPTAGFGERGEWRHLEPVTAQRGVPHLPHPVLVIT